MKACEYIASYLEFIGVKKVFGVGGANIEDIYDAIYHLDGNIEAVVAKHEFSAACMADGYSRIARDLGVVIATSGGGCLNMIPGLGESFASSEPVLAIVGMPPSNLEGLGAFQDASGLRGSLDGDKLFRPLASRYFAHFLSAETVQFHIYQAVTQSLSRPFGTSILMIPKDVQQAEVNENSPYHFKKPKLLHLAQTFFHQEDIEVLQQKNIRKLFIVGKAVSDYNAMGLVDELAKLTNSKIAVSPVAKHLLKDNDPLYLGITGVACHQNVLTYADSCDEVVVIGTFLPLMTRLGLENCLNNKPVIYINETDVHYDFSGNISECHSYQGDIKVILQNFIDRIKQNTGEQRQSDQGSQIDSSMVLSEPEFFDNHYSSFNFKEIISIINQYIKREDICFADAGNTGGAIIHYLKQTHYFGIALGMGGMGYAVGASIGACMQSSRKTYCFIGDGAFYMHGMEIHTAIEYQLPICFFVFNNNAHAMCYTREQLYYQGNYTYSVFKKANIGSGCAQMFPGFYSKDIHSLEELNQALSELKDYKGPSLLSLNVDYRELPPFLPFVQARKGNEKG